ncbi:hypothetical protein GYB22_04545 [bacterium]|nr:hypothetical protein [bacterium]
MILIADSGSTKCDWVLIDQDQSRIDTKSAGINPYFQDQKAIRKIIESDETLYINRGKITKVYFYGAGCSSDTLKARVASSLKTVFYNLTEIIVDHDMAGAAFALADGKPGICCILGTGSNSILYDGQNLVEQIPSSGFILGDEGSGAYFGKLLASKWLYKSLPDELQENFGNTFSLTKDAILNFVYREANPNRYLAQFAQFLSQQRDHPYIQQLIKRGFSEFLAIHVWCYKNFRNYPVHFTGSIAFHFQDELREVSRIHGIKIGNTIKTPIEGMVAQTLKMYS